ncbi:EcsC family protein [Thetidibacter halocola]|uniref:EcsC family protein n=1 Tax=Thetidibacter halocola TaxID=2827239 RepID=A0A8J7WDG7_9RHOB|nr:EcsC family protein [Thetidibacter halocola]MBS0123133.1 EcsC family protein [Thetidibacter halocola]
MADAVICTDGAELDAALEALARRLSGAGNAGLKVIGLINRPTERAISRLPQGTQEQLERLTAKALERAMDAASASQGILSRHPWADTASLAAAGALGGLGGLPSALVELPVTVTLMARVVQGQARAHGYDPDEMQTRRDCLLAFAAEGPVAGRDGADLGFLATRLTLTGASVRAGIGMVAPRVAALIGRSLATRAVPVLGAATGAAVNASYAGYYRDMAGVVFGLRRLSEESGLPFDELGQQLRRRAETLPLSDAS